MLELRVSLRSKAEWDAWSAHNSPHFNDWRDQVVQAVRARGVREPITGIQRPPGTIRVDPNNLRETISAAEMNSRKRAALLILEIAYAELQQNGTQRPKVLGTEALTRVGRVLRGAWSHYLATEYLPTESEREKHFPVVHLDLAQIQYPNETFDLFHSGDIFEHLPDLPAALHEIARVLRPGGIAVSTFPFVPTQPLSQMRARLIDGRLEHFAVPEYHGNPARASEGSLVFTQPGWDILDLCRESGFEDAMMTFVMSSTYGIASSLQPGIFVWSARTAAAAPVARPHLRKRPDMAYCGPSLRKIIGLIALPRSGTTLLSSILGVHSQIKAVYEPWNSNKDKSVPADTTISNFLDVFPTSLEGRPVLLVKETATYLEFIDGLMTLLRSAEMPFERHLIVLLRNPFHVFTSEVEARRSWWGEGDLQCTAEVFDRWADRSIAALGRILALAPEFNTILVSYESLVSNTQATLEAVMAALQEPMEVAQLHFESHLNLADVRGDNNIARNPTEISPDAMNKRASQAISLNAIRPDSARWAAIEAIAEVFHDVESSGVLQMATPQANSIMKSLRTILSKDWVAEAV
jgi:SAM-dependent methyltransferase